MNKNNTIPLLVTTLILWAAVDPEAVRVVTAKIMNNLWLAFEPVVIQALPLVVVVITVRFWWKKVFSSTKNK